METETTVQVIHLLLLAFGLTIGWWMGRVSERERQRTRRRIETAARHSRTH